MNKAYSTNILFFSGNMQIYDKCIWSLLNSLNDYWCALIAFIYNNTNNITCNNVNKLRFMIHLEYSTFSQ